MGEHRCSPTRSDLWSPGRILRPGKVPLTPGIPSLALGPAFSLAAGLFSIPTPPPRQRGWPGLAGGRRPLGGGKEGLKAGSWVWSKEVRWCCALCLLKPGQPGLRVQEAHTGPRAQVTLPCRPDPERSRELAGSLVDARPPARLRTRAGETPLPLASQGAECLSPVRPQQPFGLSPYLPLKETEAKFIFNPAQMYLYFTRICFLLCLMQRNKSLMGRLAMSSGRSFLTFYVGRGGAEGGLYHL